MKKLSTCELLNYIYKVTNILVIRIDSVKNIADNIKLNELLDSQRKEYLLIIRNTKDLLRKCKGIKENISLIDKISNRLINKNNIHKILVEDNKKIVEEIDKKLKTYDYSEDSVEVLTSELKKTIKKNIKEIDIILQKK